MKQVFGKNVELSLPKSCHSADATKGKILVLRELVSRGGLECNLTGEVPIFQESPQPVQEKNLVFDTLFRNF